MGFIKGQINAYINLGNYHSDKGHHEKGAELISKALEKARDHNLYNLEIRAISYLSTQHDYLDQNELAYKEMLIGIDLATKRNNLKYLSLFNMNIGVLYLSLSEYHEAINHLNMAKEFGERYGDQIILASINSNLASAYTYIYKPETAIPIIDAAITTFENNNDTDWLAFAYTIKGKANLQQGDYSSALVWFKKSEILYNTIVDDERIESILLLGMAKTYLNLEKDSIAEVHAKRAFKLAGIYKDKKRLKNASELLYILHKKKNNLVESFKYLEIFQQLSDTLAQDKSKKSMLIFKTRLDYEKEKQDLIETNEKSLTKQTNIIASILILVLILSGYSLLVLRNNKIQKKLNQELKKRESELITSNKTKNKLFSIISHDLRGPISAFSKLIGLFNHGEIDKKQFISFMPKLESDINYISFALNNLLSWGRTQMEGSITKPVRVDLAAIVTANINLLSEIANSKSIRLCNALEKQTMVWSDRDEIDIVIRNLISNALKFTPKNGSVTITASENDHNWEVSIQDSGVGMEQSTQQLIFDSNSHLTTYGTDNEKGTGLGLTLCKELIENNKGSIWVNSSINQGTCFKFTLPKNPTNVTAMVFENNKVPETTAQ